MRCVLHIGTEKTGTTLIQDWLYSNVPALSAQRVYLSEILGKTNNRLFPSFFQHHLDDWAKSLKISNESEKAAFFDGFLAKLSDEIKEASANHDLFIITSEHLHSRVTRQEDIQEIYHYLSKNFDQIDVICYFRPQADMAVSLYSTGLKSSFAGSLDDFLRQNVNPNNYYYNFKTIADNWSGVFGKHNCIFKIYDRKQFEDGDLRRDFLNLLPLELDSKKLNFEVDSSNESLHSLMSVTFKAVNHHIPYWGNVNGGVSKLNNKLKHDLKKIDALKYGTLDSDLKQDLSIIFNDSNNDFLTEYFDTDIDFNPKARKKENEKTFSYQDVELIVEQLMNTLLPYISSEPIAQLYDKDAETLRDVALKIEKNEKPSLKDALSLMQFAHRARPEGPLIKLKIKEYREKIANNA